MNDVPRKLAAIEQRFKDATIARMDGVSVDYPDWHFNVRASNTEPLLRLNLEAATPELMEKRRDEVLEVIRG
jgi:phosphomannomutase